MHGSGVRPSIFIPTLCAARMLNVTHQGQHATRPAYIFVRVLGGRTSRSDDKDSLCLFYVQSVAVASRIVVEKRLCILWLYWRYINCVIIIIIIIIIIRSYVYLVALAGGSRWWKVFTAVCVFVYLSVFPHDISKTDAARITKLDIEMFHDESWKPICFGVKRSKVKVTSQSESQNSAGVPRWVFALLWALASILVVHCS